MGQKLEVWFNLYNKQLDPYPLYPPTPKLRLYSYEIVTLQE